MLTLLLTYLHTEHVEFQSNRKFTYATKHEKLLVKIKMIAVAD